MAEDEEPVEFDFGKKKKKKDKKEKKEKDDEEADEAADGGEAQIVSVDWERGPLYTYEESLTMLYKIIEEKNPSVGTTKKYIMKPPQIVRVGSKKVGWMNFAEICGLMKRSQEHVIQFVLAEFGTEGSMAGEGQLILKGNYKEKHAESLLRKYIKEFVSCEMCKSPNTELNKDSSTRLHVVSCHNCGASRTATSIKSGYHAVTRSDRRAAKNAKIL